MKKKGIVGILITVVFVAIGSMAGRFIGEKAVDTVVSMENKKELNEIIEENEGLIDSYESGMLNDASYESEFWNLKFDFSDGWTSYTSEELASATEVIQQSAYASGMASVGDQNVDEDLIQQMFDSMYIQAEMGATYEEDGVIAGECTVSVMGGAGYEDMDIDTIVDGNAASVAGQMDGLETGTETIAGQEYKYLKVTIPSNGFDINSYSYFAKKGDMICNINCKYITGYENVLESFLDKMGALN